MDTTVKQLNIKVVTEGLDESISKVNQLGDTIHNLSSKQTTKSIKAVANSSKSENDKSSTTAAKQTSKNLMKSSSSLSRILISLISIRKLTNFFKDAFEESSSWIENLNLFEVAMKDNTEAGLEFTKTMTNAFGLDQNQLIEYMGLFNQMATAIGNATDIAYKMSEALTALGLDISSLYNISVESAMSKLRSGIAGQVKPVRELGLDITAQSLDAYIQDVLGLNMTSKMLSQSQKQLLRTIMLIRQTNNAWGDLSKTINTFSNQQKILGAQITQLKRAFGDLFVGTVEEAGIATKALYYINGALMALVEIVRTILPERTTSGFEQVNNAISDTSEYIEDLEDTVEGSLLSFDKFNALNSQDNKGQDWITELLEQGFLQEYEAYMNRFNESMNNINNKAIEIKENILGWLGYTKDVNGEWEFADKESLNSIKQTFGEIWTELKNLMPIIKEYLVNHLKNLMEFLKKVLPLILNIVKEIMPYIVSFADRLFALMIQLEEMLYPLLTWLFEKAMPHIIEQAKILFQIAEFIMAVISTIFSLIEGIVDLVKQLTKKETWKEISQMFKGLGQLGGMWLNKIGIDLFANGGFPETGQLFIANERGPEFVGNIGGNPAVANNDQIVQGITQGVYSAMMAYNSQTRNQNDNRDVYIDGTKVGKLIAKSSHKEMVRTGLISVNS